MAAKHPTFSKIINTVWAFLTQPVVLLFLIAALVYGAFIPMLGLFWDDLALGWFYEHYGAAGLARYFSTERPFWGWFYQLNMRLLGTTPWHWHAFALFWRWAASAGLYCLVRQLWKERREPAFIAGLVYLLYPGFEQQFIGNTYGHFFLVFAAFFFSVALSLYALEHPEKRKFTLPMAILLGAVNAFSMEYYFMLELMRPVFFYIKHHQAGQKFFQTLKVVFKCWLPYLVVFLAAGVWRAVSLSKLTYLNELNQSPLVSGSVWQSLSKLVSAAGKDVWLTAGKAWGQVFQFSYPEEFGRSPWLLYLGVMIAIAVLMAVFYWEARKSEPGTQDKLYRQALLFLLLGVIALLLGGIPFWTTGLIVNFDFPSDRFTLPFVMGCSFVLIGVLFLLPLKPWLRRALFTGLIALSAGWQVRIGFTYNTHWVLHERMVQQMVTRIPALEPGTLLLSDELPVKFYSDNSLAALINLIYDQNPQLGQVPYNLYYPSIRANLDLSIRNQPIEHDLRVGDFKGNTNQSLAFTYVPPSCFRVIDPEVEKDNLYLSEITRKASQLSEVNPILVGPPVQLPANIYGSNIEENWCYTFEKADLARQQGDWQAVTQIAESAFALSEQANDPAELFPYIEAHAHLGDWERAFALSEQAYQIHFQSHFALCNLWERILAETDPDPVRDQMFETLSVELYCWLKM